jgi:hypothetical protein
MKESCCSKKTKQSRNKEKLTTQQLYSFMEKFITHLRIKAQITVYVKHQGSVNYRH